jgi:hypothetical protein
VSPSQEPKNRSLANMASDVPLPDNFGNYFGKNFTGNDVARNARRGLIGGKE